MSVMRCDKHDRHWDSDVVEQCPLCVADADSPTETTLVGFLCWNENWNQPQKGRPSRFIGGAEFVWAADIPQEHHYTKVEAVCTAQDYIATKADLLRTRAALNRAHMLLREGLPFVTTRTPRTFTAVWGWARRVEAEVGEGSA